MRQVQRQQLQQRFSPQQIQLMRLLQLPVTDLELAIKEEVEKNPLLEAELPEQQTLDEVAVDHDASDWDSDDDYDGDYNGDYDGDYRARQESDPNAVRRELVVSEQPSAADRLVGQLATRSLTDRQRRIADELIGSLDDAGYLTRSLDLLANDMAFRQGVDCTPDEVEEVLAIIQQLDPPGIAARNLRECLLLQLDRMGGGSLAVRNAREIVDRYFDDFAAHRYDRICDELSLSPEGLDEATAVIRRLDPKPGDSGAESTSSANVVTPDVVLVRHDDQLQFYVNDERLPRLSLNTYYSDMLARLQQEHGDRETIQFLRSKQGDALEFIGLLRQRHETIVKVMRYLVKHQRQFLLTGNPDLLQPLRQREVAEATGLDISTISRMANSKYLQTDFGTIPLKDCFSKGMATDDGEEISVDAIRQRLSDVIAAEDKHNPLSDDALAQLLNAQGIPLARRTVAKYREQLGLPVARLRRVLTIALVLLLGLKAQAQMSYYDSLMTVRYDRALKAERAREASVSETGAAKSSSKSSAKSKSSKATSKSASKSPRPAQSAASADAAEAPSAPALPAHLAPTWYDNFPHHRVNPMGRTSLVALPDEINLLLVSDSGDFCFPVKNPKTSNYGWRWNRGHHGVDIGLRTGDPVRAAFGGTVRVASRMGGYGNCIVIRHPNGLETLYGHLSKIHVKPDQAVAAGDIIGLGGSTGNSTGPHLHFECRFLYQTFDPEWILDFSTYTLRTRRIHLDKSYFGIRQPRKGETPEYKADRSKVKESAVKPKGRKQGNTLDKNNF